MEKTLIHVRNVIDQFCETRTEKETSQFRHANMKCCHRCQTSNRCVQIIAGLPDLCLILLADRTQKPIPIVIFGAHARSCVCV